MLRPSRRTYAFLLAMQMGDTDYVSRVCVCFFCFLGVSLFLVISGTFFFFYSFLFFGVVTFCCFALFRFFRFLIYLCFASSLHRSVRYGPPT